MKKVKVLIILLAALVVLSGVAATTEAKTTATFTVNNRTFKTLVVTLVGAQENYVISSPSLQKTKVEVLLGTYQYSFYDCGQLFVGTIKLNKDAELRITTCNASSDAEVQTSPPAGYVELVLNNKTNKKLSVTLLGPETHVIDAKPGKNQITVFKGTYQMSYYDCGELQISTVTVNKDGFEVKLLNCGELSAGSSTGGKIEQTGGPLPGSILFFVKNETLTRLDVSFTSDLVYTFTVIPGRNKINLLPGPYQYSYYACGKLWIGQLIATKSRNELKISSCSTFSGKPETGQEAIVKVKNETGNKFILYLDGPQSYEFDVRATASRLIAVEKGYYYFVYTVCGIRVEGEVFLRDGFTFRTISCPSD